MNDDLKRHQTDVFSLVLPSQWEVLLQEPAALRLGEFASERASQGPYVSVSLGTFADLDALGADKPLEQRLSAYSAGFETKIIQTERRQIKGVEAIYLQQCNDTAFNNRPIKTTFHNVFLLLNGTYFLDFELVYETDQAAQFDGLLDEILERLEFGRDEAALSAAIERAEKAAQEQRKAMHVKWRDEKAEAKKQRYETYLFAPPSNGCFTARIGGLAFDLVPNTLNWQIAKLGRGLSLELCLTPQDENQARAAELVSGSSRPPNTVAIKLHCNEVYAPSGPSGDLRVVDGRVEGQNHSNVDLRMAQMRLRFNGYVYFQNGWLGLIGDLYASYDDLRDAVAISVYSKLPEAPLDWSNYQFTLAEAKSAPIEIVRHLNVPIADGAIDPAIWQMTELRHLHISGAKPGQYPHKPAKLAEIPAAIAQLGKLESLGIVHSTLSTLPDEIGRLLQLKRLNCHENAVETVPEAVLQLPNLEWLSLSHNQIAALPEHVDLPELKSLDLAYNRLKQIPQSYALQPKLTRVTLRDNPLNALPEAFQSIETGLIIADRMRLMDWRYKGADGTGLLTWDESQFLAHGSPDLRDHLHQALDGTVLDPHREALDKLALRTIWLQTSHPDDYTELGNTRFGGLPDLPVAIRYPECALAYEQSDTRRVHYEFIAQLNCRELAPYQAFLPRGGMLYFFIQDEESFAPKVLYHPSTEGLISARTLAEQEIRYSDGMVPFAPYRVKASPAASLPDLYHSAYWIDFSGDPALAEFSDRGDKAEAYEACRAQLEANLNTHNTEQQNHRTHAINGFVFTQHEDPREQAALRFKGRPEDWVVLLKVASDNEIGFQFWDAGDLFFVIHKSDLAKQDFGQIYCNIESS